MTLPTIKEAKDFLSEAQRLNPGIWIQHSAFVAEAAKVIANHHPNLDPGKAYILGCLHDIGRREGINQNRHMIDGYKFMKNRGFDEAAQICLTHSFPIQDIKATPGKWDCSSEEYGFIRTCLYQIDYTDYDRLIQLCDALAEATGFCLLEKRFVDVAIRYGIDEYTIPRWQAYIAIQNDFEKILKRSIYSLLPGVIKNTFGFSGEKG
ncbi:MAG: HD domain-containing protein [candidate division Zixibacteria bacterium]|nr:HD domain-containing protein [candidate division Zixibacteria bacterium]